MIPVQVRQVIKFSLVGVVNTGTFYGTYLVLHQWLPYYPAYVIAFVVSMVGSFFLNTYITYNTRPTWRKFLLFPLTNVTNFVVTSIGVFMLVEWLRVNERIAPLLAAVVAIPFTFLLSRRILLKGQSGASAPVPKPARSASSELPMPKSYESGHPTGRARDHEPMTAIGLDRLH